MFALAKQSRALGAYKLARHAYETLQSYRIRPAFRELIDLGSVSIRSKPFTDADELQPCCYRCSTPNPLLAPASAAGNVCVSCQQPFVLCHTSLEVLPLVEFFLEPGISAAEADKLIAADSDAGAAGAGSGADVLSMGGGSSGASDPFIEMLMAPTEEGAFTPLVVDRQVLRAMPPHEVMVQVLPPPLRSRYYRNVMPETGVTQCESCQRVSRTPAARPRPSAFDTVPLVRGPCPTSPDAGHALTPSCPRTRQQFFQSEDYELACVRKDGCCPFCRSSPKGRDANTSSSA